MTIVDAETMEQSCGLHSVLFHALPQPWHILLNTDKESIAAIRWAVISNPKLFRRYNLENLMTYGSSSIS